MSTRALSFLAILFAFGATVFADYTGSVPPSGQPSSPINIATTAQIKKGGLGIDIAGTLSNIPIGAGLYIKAGSLFIEYTGANAFAGWVAESGYALSSSGSVKSHGLVSSDYIQSDNLRLAGQSSEIALCANNSTGKLQLCGGSALPTATISANPVSISAPSTVVIAWSSTNALSCTGNGFSTGSGNPVSGSVSVSQAAATVTYTVNCMSSTGQSTNSSVTVTYGAPAIVPTATVSANPSVITSGTTTAINWSSTGAVNCVAIAPSPSAFNTNNLTSSTQSFTLSNTSPAPATVIFAVRCTSGTGNTINAQTSVVVNPAVTPI